MSRSRGTIKMRMIPVALAAALLFVLAPACAMPECASAAVPVDMTAHPCGAPSTDHPCEDDTTGHPCESFMMVDDTPDGLPAPHPPLLAVMAVDTLPVTEFFSAYTYAPGTKVPVVVDDPLGTRLRI